MTEAITSARALWESGHPDFVALIECWVAHKRCPLVLVDLLLEQGLEGAAEACRWAALEPDRPSFALRGREHHGPFPTRDVSPDDAYAPYWYWFVSGDFDSHADFVGDWRVRKGATAKDSVWKNMAMPQDALLWLLDNWRVTG